MSGNWESKYMACPSQDLFCLVDRLTAKDLFPLPAIACERYGIPEEVFLRQCQRTLLAKRHQYVAARRWFAAAAPIFFRGQYEALKLALRCLGRRPGAELEADVVFELWSEDGLGNYRFYNELGARLGEKASRGFCVVNISPRALSRGLPSLPAAYFSDYRPSAAVSADVLRREPGALPGNGTGVDSHFLWWLFLRHYAVHRTRSENMRAKVFITAGDNYLSPVRYWLLKKSGVKEIVSLQNGFRTSCFVSNGSYYNETDVYQVFGESQRELLKRQGCRAREWLPLGSLTLLSKLPGLAIRSDGPIVVIGHDFSYDIGPYNGGDFNLILEHARLFARKHRRRVLYKARTGSASERRVFQEHLECEWAAYDDRTDPYQAVAGASVCVNYLSSLGTEALGLGKRVLTCNFYHDGLVADDEDGPGVVLSKNFDEFEGKLLALTQSPASATADYFESLRRRRMTLEQGVFDEIAGRCLSFLERGTPAAGGVRR